LLNNWLKKNELISNECKQFTINNKVNLISNNGQTVYDEILTKGIIMPFKFQIKTYFEQNNNLNTAINKYNKLISCPESNTCSITNFIQGSLWKEKTIPYKNKIVMPFFMYIDDVELNNPLGSKSMCHSLSAVYYSFPLSEHSSKLNNIFLTALIKSRDIKTFGNDLCFKQIVYEINSLGNDSITINTPTGPKLVHFILGLLVGDNLGINCLCKFSKSFSANFYCRFCKAPKSIMHNLSKENGSLLRNNINYTEDLEKNDFTQTGIYKDSILNQITTFHVTDNFSVDIMHDIYEGICHYNMYHLIIYYTEKIQIFSLETLNLRKQNFDYGELEQKNLSPPIERHHLHKFHLKMSAKQMMCFVYFFSLIIGDLIPVDDEIWQFFLIFIEIIDSLLSYTFTRDMVKHLKILIEKHNSDYLKYFKTT